MNTLESQIKAWRQQLHRQGTFEDGHLEELESHLRDAIDYRVANGLAPDAAFREATKELGAPLELGQQQLQARLSLRGRIAQQLVPGLGLHSLRVTLRQFRRDRLYVWINLGGLALGLTACIMLIYFVVHETSYDRQYADQPLYRVSFQEQNAQGGLHKNAGGPVPLGLTLREDFSQVAEVTRFWRAFRPSLKAGEVVYEEHAFLWADPNAISMMGFKVLEGDPNAALQNSHTLAITESAALRYFGHTQVIGEAISYQGFPANQWEFTITALLADPPQNTHFVYDFLASMQGMNDFSQVWTSTKPLWTYVRLHNQDQLASFSEALKDIPDKYFPPDAPRGDDFTFYPEAVSEVYLQQGTVNLMKVNGDPELLRLLSGLGLLILLMVCVNFINISVARSVTRQKEIGVRKVLGARRAQVMRQVLTEASVSVFAALILALLLAYLLRQPFQQITGLVFDPAFLLDPRLFGVLMAVVLLLIVGAGLYPALRLSGFRILPALSGHVFAGRKPFISARQALIYLQCAISSAMVMSVLIIRDQLAFIENKELGASIEHIYAIPYSNKTEVLESSLSSMSGVVAFSHSQRLPANAVNQDGRVIRKAGEEDHLEVQSAFFKPGFLDLYHIDLLAGRYFNPLTHSDTAAFIINESLATELGWNPQEAIGKPLIWSEYQSGEVVGVVKDFHVRSVRFAIQPMIILPTYDQRNWQRLFISVKLSGENEGETLLAIQRAWQELNPDREYSVLSMSDSYTQLHQRDYTFAQLILFFTVVAIIISSLGLFALSAYSVERKRREIGIRKVLGSTTWQIMLKIGRPFLIISLLSLALAYPVVVWQMQSWLDGFAFRTSIQPISLLIGALLIGSIALLSVLRESLRAGWVNPVKFLREE